MTTTGCRGCRHDDHCGRQLDVDRSVGCTEYYEAAQGYTLAGMRLPPGTTWRSLAEATVRVALRVVGSAVVPPGEAVMVSRTKDGVSAVRVTGIGEPHPLLALIERLRADAERAGHEAWRHGRGSYECGLHRGEAAGLTRAADELAALARGDQP